MRQAAMGFGLTDPLKCLWSWHIITHGLSGEYSVAASSSAI